MTSAPVSSGAQVPDYLSAQGIERPGASTLRDLVLQDISFHLASGRVLGLLGRTGSGKTTLTRLLFRLYDPDRGEISLGCQERPGGLRPGGIRPTSPGETQLVDIRRLSIHELRRRVGMVTQNIQLFHASVRENLTFFDPSIPDHRILEAISDLGLGEWYHALPKGLDTDLESGGGGLSAGEAQLLAFTRIFLRNPGLVILDEATSRLDPATEGLIERAVDKLVRNRTAIIVAHRLGTVQRADDILILENGRILEWGERLRLAGDPSTRFYHLLETGLEEVLV
jgi:ABC-type multidrug transport system fused ATPase/permease subunit